MELIRSSGQRDQNPTATDIETAVWELGDEDYLILERADLDYMQTMVGVVEYRAGERQFRHELPVYNRELVRRLLLSFHGDDDWWRTAVEWEDVTEEINRGRRRSWPWAVAAVGLVVVIVWIARRFW